MPKLIVHLPHVIRLSLGHPLEYEGVSLRDFQIFQGVSFLDTLDANRICVGGSL